MQQNIYKINMFLFFSYSLYLTVEVSKNDCNINWGKVAILTIGFTIFSIVFFGLLEKYLKKRK